MQVLNLQECVPRKWGSRGWADYERPLREGAHWKNTPWRIFGSFLCEQKGTRPPGRNNDPGKKVNCYENRRTVRKRQDRLLL